MRAIDFYIDALENNRRFTAYRCQGIHQLLQVFQVHSITLSCACQSVFEVLGGKHQCSNLKDEPCMFYYGFVLIPEQ